MEEFLSLRSVRAAEGLTLEALSNGLIHFEACEAHWHMPFTVFVTQSGTDEAHNYSVAVWHENEKLAEFLDFGDSNRVWTREDSEWCNDVAWEFARRAE